MPTKKVYSFRARIAKIANQCRKLARDKVWLLRHGETRAIAI
jgi:hypothetical protein